MSQGKLVDSHLSPHSNSCLGACHWWIVTCKGNKPIPTQAGMVMVFITETANSDSLGLSVAQGWPLTWRIRQTDTGTCVRGSVPSRSLAFLSGNVA